MHHCYHYSRRKENTMHVKTDISSSKHQVISTNEKKKKSYGQFYTTNHAHILQGLSVPEEELKLIEPFVGYGHLLANVGTQHRTVETYDIDPKDDTTTKRDTLRNPPDYKGKFVITNPPYLARNKNASKELYDLYKCNDLYKIFIIQLIRSEASGGIVIIPLNFVSSIRKADVELRRHFVQKYRIQRLNIFEERVFDDTGYAVCSLQFKLRGKNDNSSVSFSFPAHIFPSEKVLEIALCKDNNYTVGGELYCLTKSNAETTVDRATKNTQDTQHITNILLKCMDDTNAQQLGFRLVSNAERDAHIDNTKNLTQRSYATLVIKPPLALEEQRELVERANAFLDKQREKYNSLFLTHYRESTSIARKRISFGLAFDVIRHLV